MAARNHRLADDAIFHPDRGSTRTRLRALVKRAGRKNTIDAEVERLHTALRVPQMRQLPDTAHLLR
jgi:hypothetical protein